MRRILFFICLSLVQILSSLAHDFSSTIDGQLVYFNIIDKKECLVEVTYQGGISQPKSNIYKGILTLPSAILWNDTTYHIVSIGPKAFSGNQEIEGIILPSSVKSIGAFAFENCSLLSKIQFPTNNVIIAQGAFFNCSSISDLVFGNNWTNIDLQMFRWSKSLKSITIPEKVSKIRNFKSIRSLSSVKVEKNNPNFSSYEGVLYNSDTTILYGCPRAYSGQLRIHKLTTTITEGALIDCALVESIVISEYVRNMSFMETSRMRKLESIRYMGEIPFATAIQGDKEVCLVFLANPNTKIIVNKRYKKNYIRALINTPGEYKDISTGKTINVEAANIPTKDHIETIKD